MAGEGMTEADRYRLDPALHAEIFERRIKPLLLEDVQATTKPVAVIFGGQPGAGKSAAVDDAAQKLKWQGGVVQIIGDDLRAFHPEYAPLLASNDKSAAFYTDRDTGLWVEQAIKLTAVHRLNVVVEGTMRNSDKVLDTMQLFRSQGFDIDARILAVPYELSEQGILQRYEAQKLARGFGRMTTIDAHRAAYDGVPKSADAIEMGKAADRIALYGRGAELLYESFLRDGHWTNPVGVRGALLSARERPLTIAERRDVYAGYLDLAVLLNRPERLATSDELNHMQAHVLGSRRALQAEVFRSSPRDQAIREFPELAASYAVVAEYQSRTDVSDLPVGKREAAIGLLRDLVANAIARGQPVQNAFVPNRDAPRQVDPGR